MAQFARPDSIITAGSWTGAATDIDESVASDADFIFSPNNPNNTVEIGLSNVSDPSSSSGHVLRVRLTQGDADGSTPDAGGTATTYRIQLFQGITALTDSGTVTSPGTWTTIAYTLTGTEADAITDYTDLRVQITATGGSGSPANRRNVAVSWVELEVPTAPAVVSGSYTANAVIRSTLAPSLTANAIVRRTLTGSFAADAIVRRVQSVSLSADAVIGSGTTTQSGSVTADAFVDLIGICTWVDPANTIQLQDATPTLVFTMPTTSVGSMYFEIQLDTASTFDSPSLRIYRSFPDSTGWEFHDGGSWQPMPATGVSTTYLGNQARFTVPVGLSFGTWYRRVRGGTR